MKLPLQKEGQGESGACRQMGPICALKGKKGSRVGSCGEVFGIEAGVDRKSSFQSLFVRRGWQGNPSLHKGNDTAKSPKIFLVTGGTWHPGSIGRAGWGRGADLGLDRGGVRELRNGGWQGLAHV